ncbi:hypothetical protein CFC21_069829 [Triticum aestivum]|uniref:BTB domain-containing protein n=2 Tax=Triticum aestivum TaxID=4565 RepID=A0A3B6LFX8_WHEAT|nr:hypothetical protein CFC21_069829 [Triticum aestivum]
MAELRKFTSAIVAEEERGTHVIKIDGYSRTKELLEAGKCTTSIAFKVGDHNWAVTFYPNGYSSPGFISVYLVLESADAKFIKQEDLERSVHLRGDSFRIRCDVTVMKKIRSEEAHANQFVVVPPSNLHLQFGSLLESKDGADVAFQVGGEILLAHRSVLAARSPVFKAELFGAMRERAGDPIEIHDIEADVFKSLLHFIYTDSLPQVDVVTANHLLVAADRYDIERLKLICQDKLCNHIGTKMVATSLALAEQHNCHGLKEACFDDGYQHLKSSCPSALKELMLS